MELTLGWIRIISVTIRVIDGVSQQLFLLFDYLNNPFLGFVTIAIYFLMINNIDQQINNNNNM